MKIRCRSIAKASGILGLCFVGVAALDGWLTAEANAQSTNRPSVASPAWTEAEAERAGRELARGKCVGIGPALLTTSPMRPEDFSIIVPYGMVIGGHVTPIDHQYFMPKSMQSPHDAYEVYAMADSRLVEIQPRTTSWGIEYRMVFAMTCTFLYYYDLVTSLAPDVKAAYDRSDRGHVDIRVKAGQLVGRIGGQTLDFAVWNTKKPLPGFAVPEHYRAEAWKRFTADPLDYYAPDLKALVLSRYVRTAEPLSGKIDYDVDGRLIGNWFLDGSNGYGGTRGEGHGDYWSGHVSFAPDVYDPTGFIVSLGSFDGQARQFAALGNRPNPADVAVASGLVKYDLATWSYQKADGSFWDRMSLVKGVKLVAQNASQGCVLAQLLDARALKLEAFPGKPSSDVPAFTSAARIYRR